MKCKDCSACRKWFWRFKPDTYVCIGIKEPFAINDIENECTEYPEKNIKNPKEKIDEICSFLEELKKYAPCHGGLCIGYQNCELGENGCYGESCAIDDVIEIIPYYISKFVEMKN